MLCSPERMETPPQANATQPGPPPVAGAPVPSPPQLVMLERQLSTIVTALRRGLTRVAVEAPAGAVAQAELNGFLNRFGELEATAVALRHRLETTQSASEAMGLAQEIDLLQQRAGSFVQAVESAVQHLRVAPLTGLAQVNGERRLPWVWVVGFLFLGGGAAWFAYVQGQRSTGLSGERARYERFARGE